MAVLIWCSTAASGSVAPDKAARMVSCNAACSSFTARRCAALLFASLSLPAKAAALSGTQCFEVAARLLLRRGLQLRAMTMHGLGGGPGETLLLGEAVAPCSDSGEVVDESR